MASTWNETRTKRPPREGKVAEYRAQIDAKVRAYRLKEIREEQGLTQVELAERMHVTQPSVSDLERGALDRAGHGGLEMRHTPAYGEMENSARHRAAIGGGGMATTLTRPADRAVIAGVCAGLADRFGMKPSTMRWIFVLSCLLPGPQILIYIALWLIMPKRQ